MSDKSAIEWTESTWNPLTGCTKISPGCKYCYAERLAKRLQAMGQPNYKEGFRLSFHEEAVSIPLSWKKPRTIFVNSMSDLFHKNVQAEFIKKIFDVMNKAKRHRFQILTKRSDRLLTLNDAIAWPENVWMGVSVESDDYLFRVDHLRNTDAHIKFISFEPLLGPIPNINLKGIDWVIVGGESGPGARVMEEEWVLSIRDQCEKSGIPFFFKQWGGVRKHRNGRMLEGRTWDEMPI
ncbi:MAG: phage Gp37/Gp68 family protein [Candidatus Omnitrophota bacterium]